MGWISNLMTGAVVIGVIAIAVYLYRQSKKGVKLSIGDLFTSNSNEKLETIATISTIVEIISLSLLGIERGVEPFSAFMRYTLVGFFELVATFVFLKASTSFQLWIAVKVVKDGKIDFLEALWIRSRFWLWSRACKIT